MPYPKCPKCGGQLEPTETEGYWCPNGCYESEYDVWLAFQEQEKRRSGVSKTE